MLSVNIPVYNYEVGELVAQLILQAQDLKIEFEIRIYDDGSEEKFKLKNRLISKNSNVVYLELKGRFLYQIKICALLTRSLR